MAFYRTAAAMAQIIIAHEPYAAAYVGAVTTLDELKEFFTMDPEYTQSSDGKDALEIVDAALGLVRHDEDIFDSPDLSNEVPEREEMLARIQHKLGTNLATRLR